MKKYNAEELYTRTGVKGLQKMSAFLRGVAIAILPLGFLLSFAMDDFGVSFLVALCVFISVLITLPFINGIKTLVVYTVKNNQLMEEMLELAKKQSQKEPESNKEADKQ